MANGSRRGRKKEEYVFVDGRAVRAEDAAGGVSESATVPGQAEAKQAAGERVGAAGHSGAAAPRGTVEGAAREALDKMESEDALALREDAARSLGTRPDLRESDRRIMRRKYLVFGVVLALCVCVSCCADPATLTFRSPFEVLRGFATWVQVRVTGLLRPQDYADVLQAARAGCPAFGDIAYQAGETLKFALCGCMLAISGMLYQNAFRNPIAAPSLLGVTNGVQVALVVLVLQFGWFAYQHIGLYFLYSYLGGAIVLAVVMVGGKWMSGKGRFNTVNMILFGTIVSQLLGVIVTYIQNNFMTEINSTAYTLLTKATDIPSTWTFVSLLAGFAIALVPVFLFRFKLNLVSFADEETRLLGVDPNKLRLLALGCGSVMILTATVNAGQVAMVSLVVPFVVRAVFGSEFRKQLGGNLLVGAILLVICGLLGDFVVINEASAGLGPVTTIIALPLFVWMIAIRQRSWD